MLFCGQDNKIANGVLDDRLSKIVMVPWHTHKFFFNIIIIIIIGATARFGPRPSSEASASRPCSLQHSSSFSPPMSWHHP
jgi:hypothetical protein